eukprot:COSAG01_NODE_113_length_25617_cov_10.523492_4_plen_583_part_00
MPAASVRHRKQACAPAPAPVQYSGAVSTRRAPSSIWHTFCDHETDERARERERGRKRDGSHTDNPWASKRLPLPTSPPWLARTGFAMLDAKVFVAELGHDLARPFVQLVVERDRALSSRAIAFRDVAPLAHELRDNAEETRVLVVQGRAGWALALLARAQQAKVFRSEWHGLFEQLHHAPTRWSNLRQKQQQQQQQQHHHHQQHHGMQRRRGGLRGLPAGGCQSPGAASLCGGLRTSKVIRCGASAPIFTSRNTRGFSSSPPCSSSPAPPRLVNHRAPRGRATPHKARARRQAPPPPPPPPPPLSAGPLPAGRKTRPRQPQRAAGAVSGTVAAAAAAAPRLFPRAPSAALRIDELETALVWQCVRGSRKRAERPAGEWSASAVSSQLVSKDIKTDDEDDIEVDSSPPPQPTLQMLKIEKTGAEFVKGKFDARFRAHYSDCDPAHIGRSKTRDCLTWLYSNYTAVDLDEASITQGAAEAANAVSRQLPATSKEVMAHEKSSKLQAGTAAITSAMKSGSVQQIMQSIRSFQRIVNGERFKTRTGGRCIATDTDLTEVARTYTPLLKKDKSGQRKTHSNSHASGL